MGRTPDSDTSLENRLTQLGQELDQHAARPGAVSAIEAQGVRRSTPTLVLAEDHPLVSAALVRLLREHFSVVEVVVEGQALIDRVDTLRPDLIVTDISLEGMDGLSATRAIRRRHPSIPIVVITAQLDPAFGPAALAAGASAFLLKRNVGQALVDVLQSLIRPAEVLVSRTKRTS
jgi:DNA-binding NarL/FixJ family response regulator